MVDSAAMERRERGSDEIISEAMEQGACDNLPGKGKPLKLDENPYMDDDWQLAYHLLKENGYAPEFIERRQPIKNHLAAAHEQLAHSWTWRSEAQERDEAAEWVESRGRAASGRFEAQVAEINQQIRDYNLTVPRCRAGERAGVCVRRISKARRYLVSCVRRKHGK